MVKNNIDKRYESKKEAVEHQQASDKMMSKNDLWEQKMIKKGYRTVQLMGEMIPTYVFASPERQAEIAALNAAHRKHVLELREELKKQFPPYTLMK